MSTSTQTTALASPAEPPLAGQAAPPEERPSWGRRRRTHLPASARGWSRAIIWSLIGLTGFGVIYASVVKMDTSISAPGRLRPIGGTLDVIAPFAAPIEQVRVRDGELVRAGQVLVEFDGR
jgi:multidrug efflux pump subunit AcrA (membrane-fusion protein)